MDHVDHCVFWFSTVPSLRPAVASTTTETNERIRMGLTETGAAGSLLCFFFHVSVHNFRRSWIHITLIHLYEIWLRCFAKPFTVLIGRYFYFAVSVSETLPYISYVLYGTVPVLLLLLIAAAAFFCYKYHAKRYKQRRCYTARPLDTEDSFILQCSLGLLGLLQEED